ncbi:HigA family addiction module antitoxin [Aestuariivirga sp.]|uniref:HigA family addiction module antitoxin n=1 Tax=Aestuariivirga sp. TaxID=2650926 RepID=UPI003BACCD29
MLFGLTISGGSASDGPIKGQPMLKSLTTIEGDTFMSLLMTPSHPGDVLQELYLTPLGLSPISLARRIHVPRTRIERLLRGETAVTADTAMRLARVFGTTAEYWLNLQRGWDLARARETIDVSGIEPLAAA